ncbi:MAG: putative DNA-binding domain-containing protein [Myxococcales bacterium]|nr:putative DNA-binding domain-containing protein [Myxococcales bacterium]
MSPLQRAIADACLGASAGESIAADLRAFLESRGVAPGDVEAVLAAPRRLAVYRSLVRNGISGVVDRVLPRSRARLNAAACGRFDADLAAFVDAVGPRTRYLRDVPGEFLAWASPAWRADPIVPTYIVELAAHELARFALATAESTAAPHVVREIAFDRGLAFAAPVRLERYAWAVHALPPELEATDPPARVPEDLLGYRDAEDEVRWIELPAVAADVLAALLGGEPLGPSVTRACAERGTDPASTSTAIARLLADLAGQGVIVGAR